MCTIESDFRLQLCVRCSSSWWVGLMGEFPPSVQLATHISYYIHFIPCGNPGFTSTLPLKYTFHTLRYIAANQWSISPIWRLFKCCILLRLVCHVNCCTSKAEKKKKLFQFDQYFQKLLTQWTNLLLERWENGDSTNCIVKSKCKLFVCVCASKCGVQICQLVIKPKRINSNQTLSQTSYNVEKLR